MNEKRAFSRWKKRLLVDLVVEGRTATGFTWDISHTGLSISSQYVPKLGEKLRTIVHLPNGKKVECHGTVVRVRRVPLALADAVRATPLIADVDKDGDTDLVAAGWEAGEFPSVGAAGLVVTLAPAGD